MGQIVDQYLQQKRAEAAKAEYQKKADILIQEGLIIKDYSPTYEYNEAYPEIEYEGENAGRYYRIFPIAVSDEEFEEIKKYHDSKKVFYSSNGVANALKVLAIIVYVISFIAGIILGCNITFDRHSDFSFGVALTVWLYGAISGTLLLGLHEMISLLQSIKDKVNK